MSVSAAFRSGFVAVMGLPNVGKSTLLNQLLDFKIAIVSPKAQTTRDAIRGIYTDDQRQIVFVDTPGLMDPQDQLNRCLRDAALNEMEGADALLHLVEAARPKPLPEEAQLVFDRIQLPKFLGVNKIDLTPKFEKGKVPPEWNPPFSLEPYQAVLPLSAKDGTGLPNLLDALTAALPVGDLLFDPDQCTDRDLRFLSAELVREKALQCLEQELPYALACQTDEFIERQGAKHCIRVTLYVEQESQKGIVIGEKGAMLRRIGSLARPEIEELCDHPVYLELWVKVRKNWRKRDGALSDLGYQASRPGKKRG